MAKTVTLISLGCAKNLINSEQMLYLLREAGFAIVPDVPADVAVVNTCGFIESAKAEAIETIIALGREKSEGKLGRIVVAGCLAERYKDEILSELPEVDAVAGTGSYDDIVAAASGGTQYFGDIDAPVSETDRILTTPGAWAYLKIAEGCSNRCAYCVIPSLRGDFRSRTMENIVSEAEGLAARGVREIIIVAQDVTRYGTDLYGERKLAELLLRLEAIDGIAWIRLHYLYPDEIDDKLIDVIAGSEKVLKYLDIPIQHISDKVLGKMRRRGTGDEIRGLFGKLRERIPGLVLRTSLITGLPGEGDAQFEELCEFLLSAKIERAGVFPYSPEEGTDAARMKRPAKKTTAWRAELITELQSRVMDAFNESRIGTTVTVLVEGRHDDGVLYGRSYAESPDIDGYIRIASGDAEPGEFCRVRITGSDAGEVTGEILSNGAR